MKVEFIEADGAHAERWRTMFDRLPRALQDLHFLPEYGEIYRKTYGFKPILAVMANDDAAILQPFLLRPLTALPFVEKDAADMDIANAYGFGGPVGYGDAEALMRLAPRFCEGYSRQLKEMGAASEFCSLHPFMHEHQRMLLGAAGIGPVHEKDVCYADTNRTEDELTAGLGRGVRSKLSRARRDGVKIEKVEMTAANLERFEVLYRHTMARNGAAARWYFPDGYFSTCAELLGDERTSLFFATLGGELATAYFLIHDFDTAYYHFGASHEAFFDHRPNDLMLVETALWAVRAGFSRYHLGGGVTSAPDDPLVRFKSSVGSLRAPLLTYFRVHDDIAYARLSALKRQHEIEQHGQESTSSFVPAYRRPFIGEQHP